MTNAETKPTVPSRPKELILLVHGIRTFAVWQPIVKRVLEEIPNTQVKPIKYGYFDAFQFWCPIFTRHAPIDDVRRQIQIARFEHPDALLSVIAHSFGTYAISRILLEIPDLKFYRMVFCGSIVPRSFRWDYVRPRIATEVINDYGTRDIWPVWAKTTSWGYGDTGRHGFGRGATVSDRGHSYKHSDFFNEDFVRTYWKPWFEDGHFVPSKWDEVAPPSPWLLSVLSILPLQWIFVVVLLGLVVLLGRNRFQPQPQDVTSASTTVTLRFSDSKELIERGFQIDLESDRSFRHGENGVLEITSVPGNEVQVANAVCEGFEYQSTVHAEDGAINAYWILMTPKSERSGTDKVFWETIKPADDPSPDISIAEYRRMVENDRPKENVTLICVNDTDHGTEPVWIDILLFHFVPKQLATEDFAAAVFQTKWTPITRIAPGESRRYEDFGHDDGYYLIYASKHGEQSQLICEEALLYQTLTSEPNSAITKTLRVKLESSGKFKTENILE